MTEEQWSTQARATYKQTLLHNYPYRTGVREKDRERHIVDPVTHIDAPDCECEPTLMIWAPIAIWNEDVHRNMTVFRWVDAATYVPPPRANFVKGNGNGQ